MGNLNAKCLSSVPPEHCPKPTINTDLMILPKSNISIPLISSSTSFNLTVSISSQLLTLHQTLSKYLPNPIDFHIENNTAKDFIIEYDCETTFANILKQFSLTHLLDINAIKMCIVDDTDTELIIRDLDQTLTNALKALPNQCKINIELCDNWHTNKVHKIAQINSLITNVIFETQTECEILKECKTLEILRRKYDVINHDIMSKFVKIDSLIDSHGNDIASLECLVHGNTHKNRMLISLKKKIHKMDSDLQNISQKWTEKSTEMERYLRNIFDKCVRQVLSKYKLWNTEQLIYWVQYVLKDKVRFDSKDIEKLKIANIAGISIGNLIDRDILQMIGIRNEILQNIIIASVHNLMDRYDTMNKMNIW